MRLHVALRPHSTKCRAFAECLCGCAALLTRLCVALCSQRALVVLHDAGSVLPLCTAPDLFFEALYSTPRPAAAPGQQVGEAPVANPPDCVNVTDTANGSSGGAGSSGGGAWVPLMQRCFAVRQRYVDVAALTGMVNPVSGTPVPNGYVMSAVGAGGGRTARLARLTALLRTALRYRLPCRDCVPSTSNHQPLVRPHASQSTFAPAASTLDTPPVSTPAPCPHTRRST